MPEAYAAHLDLTPVRGVDPPHAFLGAIREWVGARWPAEREWFQLEESAGVRASDGSIFRWEPYSAGDACLLEFTWRHPHIADPTIIWSTQAAFYSTSRGYRLALRVSNTGPEFGEPSALLTTRPRLATLLEGHFTVRGRGFQCRSVPRTIGEGEFPDFVRYELFNPARDYPIIVLSPNTDGTYEVVPEQLARDFLTLGEVVVAETPQSTFALTRELERRELSCFHGALRIYLPGLKRDADPFRHPLLTPRHLGVPANRLRMAQFLAARQALSFKPDPRFHALRDERALHAEDRRHQLLSSLEALRTTSADVGTWQELAESYARENNELRERNTDLTERMEEAEKKIAGLRFALTARRRAQDDTSDEEPEFVPSTVLEAVEYAQELFPTEVRVLTAALESAADSPYSRPEDVWHALRGIQAIATKLKTGPLGRNLKDAFAELGLEYRSGIAPTTPKKLREQYRFTEGDEDFTCEEHLCIGGGSYDPATCLRIYLSTTRRGDSTVIIGHVGRHLDGLSTT